MNYLQHLPILAIAIPLIAVPIVPILGMGRRDFSWHGAFAASAVQLVTAYLLLKKVLADGTLSYHMGGWIPPIGIELRVDILSAFVLLVTVFIGFICLVYAKKSVEKEIDKERIPAFYAVYLLFIIGLCGMIVTGDIFNLYVFLEITSLAGYALIASGRRRYSVMASFNYLILGTIAATFIVLGIAYLYMVTGTLNMYDMSTRLPELYQSRVVIIGFVFIVIGLLIKMAVFPLHLWLPDAYKYAPSVVSAAMSATSTKVGAYVLIRLTFTIFDIEFSIAGLPVTDMFIIIASVATIAGSVMAISQSNIKYMLAYSSVGQIGYIVLAIAMVNPVALAGGIVHVLNHALMKGGLFMVVGMIAYRLGVEDIDDMRGLGKKMPLAAFAFTIFSLSIIGIPLTVGFVSKWYLVTGAIDSGHWFLIAVILLSSLLTAIYFGRVINTMYFKKDEDAPKPVKSEAPFWMNAPTLFIAFLCVFFGIFATAPVEISMKAADVLFGAVLWK